MKPIQPFVVLNALVLALALICAATILGLPDSLVLAADRPAREQTKSVDKGKDSGRKEQDSGKGKQADGDKKPAETGKAENSGKSGDSGKQENSDRPESNDKEGRASGEKGAASRPSPPSPPPQAVVPLPGGQPTATVATPRMVSIDSISVIDPCQMRGTVSFSGPYWGTLTLQLTYHVTGSSSFDSSGVTWSRKLAGETESDYSLSMNFPEPEVEQGSRVNTYRVEVDSADPQIANPTVKSSSFHCDEAAAESTSEPTVTRVPPSPTISAPTPDSTYAPTATVPTLTQSPTASVPTAALSPTAPAPTSTTSPGIATPTATAGPDATETPVETLPPTLVAPSPTAGTQPSPTPTATPTPSLVAVWTTRIAPDRNGSADPGSEILYTHTVTNEGTYPDIKEIRAHSSLEWTTEIVGGDGTSPLPDSDHNGAPDTGVLNPGQSVEIAVRLRVQEGAHRGLTDVTRISAVSTADPSGDGSASVTDTTAVNGVITLSLSTRNVAFGDISPMGTIPATQIGLASSATEDGAYYTKSPAVTVTVNSNAAWTGSLSARENDGSARTIRIADGDLQWRLSGDSGWRSFDQTSSEMAGTEGSSNLIYDYQLRVFWEDDPGGFSSVVTYNVSQ